MVTIYDIDKKVLPLFIIVNTPENIPLVTGNLVGIDKDFLYIKDQYNIIRPVNPKSIINTIVVCNDNFIFYYVNSIFLISLSHN